MEELEALLILNLIPNIGIVKKRRLIRHFGSALAALEAPLEKIENQFGFSPKNNAAWKQGGDANVWKEDLKLLEQFETEVISFLDPRYPQRLLELDDSPLLLYCQGQLIKKDSLSIAIVGTRQATLYGQEVARELSRGLARAGFTIVSGLARGIDTAAHSGAIEYGRSIAVLGSGLKHIYPIENKKLAEEMKEKGALLSEFNMAAAPNRFHFPKRNRIVSGMTIGTILIEAPEKSGAMITVEQAQSLGKPIFTIPGRIDQPSFKGNHLLLKQKKAFLIENIQDILSYFNLHLPDQDSKMKDDIPLEEKDILNKMPSHELTLEELLQLFPLPITQLNRLMMHLVLKKRVKEYPGKIYKKID